MLKRVLQTVVTGYQAVETACSRIAAVVIMLIMFLTTADVTGRYVFNSPIQIAYDTSLVLMVGVVFLGIAYVQSIKGHVRIDIVTSWMPKRAQLALDIFGYVIGLAIMAVIAWFSGGYAWKAFITHDRTMGIVPILVWPGKSMIPFGAGLICVRLLIDIVTDSARFVSWKKAPEIVVNEESIE